MIEAQLPVLSIVILLLAAPVCALLKPRMSYYLAALSLTITFCISIKLLLITNNGEVLLYNFGNWPSPIGIEYRIDILSAYILVILNFIALVTIIFGYKNIWHEIAENKISIFLCLFLLCIVGLTGITCSNDAFNIYVFLEISSLSIYSLIAMGKNKRSALAAFEYLILGTVGATFILIGIGMLYMMTGTLNISDIAQRIIDFDDHKVIMTAFAFLTIGLALKIALFPLHLWLCNAYTYAPQFVSSFLSGTSTKIFIYLMFRFVSEFIEEQSFINLYAIKTFIIILSISAICLASYIAILQIDIKRMLAYSSVAQIGYITLGLALFTHESILSSVIHIFNHAVTKVAAFMIIGQIAIFTNSSKYNAFYGIGRVYKFNSCLLIIALLSLIGFPLTVGFISKWYLLTALVSVNSWYLVFMVIIGSVLSIIYSWKLIEILYFKKSNIKIRGGWPKIDYFAQFAIITLSLSCIIFGIFAMNNIDLADKITNNIMVKSYR